MGERTGADGGVPLRVVSYNIHTQRDDTAALAAVVRDLAPDVLIVQEGPRRFRWREKSAALARSVGMVVAAGGLPGLGNLLLTTLRVRVRETAYARYPLTPGRHLRGTFRSDCEVPGARFTVAGAHLAIAGARKPFAGIELQHARVLEDAHATFGQRARQALCIVERVELRLVVDPERPLHRHRNGGFGRQPLRRQPGGNAFLGEDEADLAGEGAQRELEELPHGRAALAARAASSTA